MQYLLAVKSWLSASQSRNKSYKTTIARRKSTHETYPLLNSTSSRLSGALITRRTIKDTTTTFRDSGSTCGPGPARETRWALVGTWRGKTYLMALNYPRGSLHILRLSMASQDAWLSHRWIKRRKMLQGGRNHPDKQLGNKDIHCNYLRWLGSSH